MICALDIETDGLDTRKFILGCIICDTGERHTFWDAQRMWKWILHTSEKLAKQKKKLTIYSYSTYDFYGIADFSDTHLEIISERPLIAHYRVNHGESILCHTLSDAHNYIRNHRESSFRFLSIGKPTFLTKTVAWFSWFDLMNLFPSGYGGSKALANLGNLLDFPKAPTPSFITEGRSPTDEEKFLAAGYCMRDAELVLRYLTYLRTFINEEGITIRHLITINQVAQKYLLNHLHTLLGKDQGTFFKSITTTTSTQPGYRLHPTHNASLIHQAVRSGIVYLQEGISYEADVTAVDVNSLYPFAATHITFPRLNTEYLLRNPLRHISLDTLLAKPGVSTVLIENTHDPYPLLLCGTPQGNIILGPGCFALGTYTHEELRYARTQGYVIHHISESVCYEPLPYNPLSTFYTRLYEKRIAEPNTFRNIMLKSMMNSSIGKFAEHRERKTTIIVPTHLIAYYESLGYLLRTVEDTRSGPRGLMSFTHGFRPKPGYAPILNALITSKARCIMHHFFTRIPISDLLYSDTDSIFYRGHLGQPYPLSSNLGEFKCTHEHTEATFKSKKAYKIGTKLVAAGIPARHLTEETFTQGHVTLTRIHGIASAPRFADIGAPFEETLTLWEPRETEDTTHTKVYKDYRIKDIQPFIPFLDRITHGRSQNSS